MTKYSIPNVLYPQCVTGTLPSSQNPFQHSPVSIDSPGHSFPPPLGEGFEQVLFRLRCPRPHPDEPDEQFDQLVQLAHSPSTRTKWLYSNCSTTWNSRTDTDVNWSNMALIREYWIMINLIFSYQSPPPIITLLWLLQWPWNLVHLWRLICFTQWKKSMRS